MKRNYKWILFLVVPLIIIVSASLFGLLFEMFFGKQTGGWIGDTGSVNYIFGVFMATMFFVPLALTVFGDKNKYTIIIIFSVLGILFFYGSYQLMVLNGVTAIIGWLFGEVLLFIYKKIIVRKK